MKKKIVDKSVQYHIGLSREMLQGAKYALLPGDPGRVEKIAKRMDSQATHLMTHREYTSFLAHLDQQPVLVCSTGIGGPSTGICVEELAMIGVENLIRIGTCGTIQENIQIGDMIISSAAVRLDGTSRHYAPLAYPAVADFTLTRCLADAAAKITDRYHIGITASSDTFYAGQERYDSFTGYVRRAFQGSLKEWQQLNVLNFEMEAATLFTLCSIFRLRAASICAVMANRTRSEIPDKSEYEASINNCIDTIKLAIEKASTSVEK